jgi:hypothetical protein
MNELSVQQQELLLEQLLYPDSAFYNVGGCLVVQGGLKTEILQKVMNRIADLNPIWGPDWLRVEQVSNGTMGYLKHNISSTLRH